LHRKFMPKHLFHIIGTLHISREKIMLMTPEKAYRLKANILTKKSFIHGDIVRGFYHSKRNNNFIEIESLTLIQRTKHTILWEIQHTNQWIFFTVLPEFGNYRCSIDTVETFQNGSIVEWKFDTHGNCILRDIHDLQKDFDRDELVLLFLHNITPQFPAIPELEIQHLQKEWCIDTTKRQDFRDWYTFTIDWADAKDLDDALSIQPNTSWWFTLWVHIADVSEYVLEWGILDKEAKKRGTSIYTPGKVIPMLPEILSNNLCSLHPGKAKLTLSCILEIDSTGNVIHTTIQKWIIQSAQRSIYDQVQIQHDGGDSKAPLDPTTLHHLYQLHEILAKRRQREWKILFTTTEVQFLFEKETLALKQPTWVKIRPTWTAYSIIEECMVLANEEVAKWCSERNIPFLSRVHLPPTTENTKIIHEVIHGGKTSKKDGVPHTITPKDIRTFLDALGWNTLYRYTKILLPKMTKAHYSNQASWHFWLALEYYSHFTSPIRRYPDLQTHRIIKHYLDGTLDEEKLQHYKKTLEKIAKHCSEKEKEAESMSRAFIDLYACRFMKWKEGKIFEGKISGALWYTLFVEISNGISIALPIEQRWEMLSDIHGNFFSRKWKKLYTLWESIQVQISYIDFFQKRIYWNHFQPFEKKISLQ
jgi:ribonuclease R